MAAILEFDMNLLSLMFYAFYQLNNGSIGFLVSENIQKLLIYVFMSIIPKDIAIYRSFCLGVGHLGFFKFMGFSGKIQLGIISKFF